MIAQRWICVFVSLVMSVIVLIRCAFTSEYLVILHGTITACAVWLVTALLHVKSIWKAYMYANNICCACVVVYFACVALYMTGWMWFFSYSTGW